MFLKQVSTVTRLGKLLSPWDGGVVSQKNTRYRELAWPPPLEQSEPTLCFLPPQSYLFGE